MMKHKLACLAALAIGATWALADTRQDCEGFAILKAELEAKIRACTKIIEADGNAAWAYSKRGEAYAVKRDHLDRRALEFVDRAIADHTKAIEIDPRGAIYYYNRAQAYGDRRLMVDPGNDDFDRQIADLTKAIEIEPRAQFYSVRAANYALEALTLDAWGKRDRARDFYLHSLADRTKAIEIEPRADYKAGHYRLRASDYEKLGRRAEAIADLWESVALDPITVHSWNVLRRLLPQADKQDAAVLVPPASVPGQPKAVEPEVRSLSPSRSVVPLTPAEERALQPKETFKECDACPEMVVVPAGEFIMGSPLSEAGRDVYEGPQRKVIIARPFAAGRFEVTFAEWDACVAAGGCKHRPGDEGWGRGRRPVIFVTSKEVAKEYLPWLSQRTGKTYRLLSEAEWEYAARAGTSTRYAFGDTISPKQARFSEGKRGSAGKTVEVGSFQANSFGLHDMHGNVSELVEDTWHAYHRAPLDGSVRTGTYFHVLRGGSWSELPDWVRSAVRYYEDNVPQGRYTNKIGFRVARSLSP